MIVRRTSRRTMIRIAAAAALATHGLTARGGTTHAQESPMATPNALGSAIPPELTAYANDWPAPQGNLAAHLAASASPLSAATIDRLEAAWRFPLTASSGYGAATGEMVALRVSDGSLRWNTAVPAFLAAGATVANDVVFSGGLDGIVRGFATATGDEIWSYQTGAGLNAPLAIAGDMLLVPAGGPLISRLETAPALWNEPLAFRLPGEMGPPATPRAEAPPLP